MRQILMMAALLMACGQSSTGLKLGEDFDLRYGASVVVPGDTMHVRFSDVVSDSRCPSGAQCVWAGEATILLTAAGGQLLSLTLDADAEKAMATVMSTRITLVALKPYPSVNAPIAKGNYVATLRFGSTKD
jgi:hypothetical protein